MKSYGPEGRIKCGVAFCEDRLYVFGGINNKKEPCEKINWVFDLDKGAWFGLEMNYPETMVSSKPLLVPWNSRQCLAIEQTG